MAGLLTYSGFRGLPVSSGYTQQPSQTVAKEFRKLALELTAAGLFRIFTGFPFHHLSKKIGEPMLGQRY
jgi:hypothetical protein